MKMIDIFGYNYKMTYGIYTDARVDGMAMPANMGFGMLFTNEEAPKAVCHAVNNHDRLTEENAKLRKMLKYAVNVANDQNATYTAIEVMNIEVQQLLNQLKEQQNEQAN